jgi:YesN/AraC family two-component response regulator
LTGNKKNHPYHIWYLAKILYSPDIPVILCSGFSERISKKKAMAMGIKAYLMKPLLREEMVLDGLKSSI